MREERIIPEGIGRFSYRGAVAPDAKQVLLLYSQGYARKLFSATESLAGVVRWRHGHPALLKRHFHQPLLRRAERLAAGPDPRHSSRISAGRGRGDRNQYLRRERNPAGAARAARQSSRHKFPRRAPGEGS